MEDNSPISIEFPPFSSLYMMADGRTRFDLELLDIRYRLSQGLEGKQVEPIPYVDPRPLARKIGTQTEFLEFGVP